MAEQLPGGLDGVAAPSSLPSAIARAADPAGLWGFTGLVLGLSAVRLVPAHGSPWFALSAMIVGGGLSPLWAAWTLTRLRAGPSEFSLLVRHSLRWRVGPGPYIAAVVSPVAVVGCAGALNNGAPASTSALPPAATVVAGAALASVFALAENLGWRAWLQRGLEAHLPTLVAGAVVGVVWAVWHLPLFLSGVGPMHDKLDFWAYSSCLLVFSMLLATIFVRGRYSVVPVVVAHVAFNVAVQLAVADADPSTSSALLWYCCALFGVLVGLAAWRWPGIRRQGCRR